MSIAVQCSYQLTNIVSNFLDQRESKQPHQCKLLYMSEDEVLQKQVSGIHRSSTPFGQWADLPVHAICAALGFLGHNYSVIIFNMVTKQHRQWWNEMCSLWADGKASES